MSFETSSPGKVHGSLSLKLSLCDFPKMHGSQTSAESQTFNFNTFSNNDLMCHLSW